MEIAKVSKADGYFGLSCSWERGLNENTNGLIRQYLSKGTDFNKLTDRQVLEIMDKLNNRPRNAWGTRHPIRYSSGSNYYPLLPRVARLGQRIGEVDPIAVPTMLVTRIRQPLGQAHEDSCQVLRKDLGVEILQ